ncbi:uncharacterized protein METZ01_LOCUS465744, partial [marine metagenome]
MLIKVGDFGEIINGETGEVWDKEKLAYEIKNRTDYLLNKGVNEKSKLIIAHGGTAAFFSDLFSAWNIGAVVACVNPGLKPFEMNNIIDFLGPDAILISGQINTEYKTP